jgi:hypothetical protein
MPHALRRVVFAAALAGAVSAPALAQSPPTVRPGVPSWNGAPFSGVPSYTNEPGTVQAYFRGRLTFDASLVGDSGDNVGGNKNRNYVFREYARLYPSFEGTTANGLRYGAYLEIRQNAGGATASGNTSTATLIFRRETGYVSGGWGTLRFGGTDGVLSLFQTGSFENFGDNWNDHVVNIVDTAAAPAWPFPNASGNYGNSKVVYLSPNFSGFDFGVSFEPSTSGTGEGNTAAAGAGGIRVSSVSGTSFTAGLGSLQKNKDTLEFAGRYRGSFGPIGVIGSAGMVVAGNVKNGGLTGLTANGSPQYGFKDVWAVNTGLVFTYGGLAVGGDLYTGAVNPNGSRNTFPVKQGSANALAFLVGTSYAVGPVIVGASVLNTDRAGNYAQDLPGAANGSVGRMHEVAAAIGGTYGWAPGAALSLTYLYGERHQRGVNLFTTTAGAAGNNSHANALVLFNNFVW